MEFYDDEDDWQESQTQELEDQRSWDDRSPVDRPTALGTAWVGIILAGGMFPLFVGGAGFCFSIAYWGLQDFRFAGAPNELIYISLWGLFCFAVGLIYAIIGSIPAVLLLYGFQFVTQNLLTDRGACGVFGGLTGFLCTTGGGIFFANDMPEDLAFWPYYLIVAGAIVIGHCGAVLKLYRAKEFDGFPYFSPILNADWRMTISFLLKITFALAVWAIAFKSMSEFGCGGWFAKMWCLYVVVQVTAVQLDRFIQTRLLRRTDLPI